MSRLKTQVTRRIQPQPRRSGRALFFVLGSIVAGLVAYFFDPQQGRRRRAVLKDMTGARLRRGQRDLRTVGVHAANKAQGVAARMQHHEHTYNDPTLAHKIESEVLRHQDFPAGRINVNAEDGRVVLRGVLDQPEDIKKLEERVRQVPGVRDVENLVHLRGSA